MLITYNDFLKTIDKGNEAKEHAKFIPMDSKEYKQAVIDSILLHRKAMIIQNIVAYKKYGNNAKNYPTITKNKTFKPYYTSLGTLNN